VIPLKRYAGSELTLTAAGLPEGADALVLTQAVRKRGSRAMFIARDDTRASTFAAGCQFFAPDIPVLSLPSWDCLPYDRVSPSRTLAARRAGALHTLATTSPDLPLIVVTTISAVLQYVPPRDVLRGTGFQAEAGQVLHRSAIETYLSDNGYARASTVMERGDFAIRGGLIDVFPPGLDNPIRLDFFGDDLESIRSFDLETQRTIKQQSDVNLAPVNEVLMSDLTISKFRKNYIATFGGGVARDPIYAAVVEGIRPQGIEHYLPLFYDGLETVFDYAGVNTLIAFDGLLDEARRERNDLIEDFHQSRAEHVKDRRRQIKGRRTLPAFIA